jgi:chemotaxis protein CheD
MRRPLAAIPIPAVLAADGPLIPLPVRIGEIRAASGPGVLFSVGLGSCVAVALYDARTATGGIAHVMLPQGRANPAGDDVRHAEAAIPRLLELMRQEGASRAGVRARIAGGASMFRGVLDGDGLRLGRRNVEAVREALHRDGIPVDAEDVFGTHGRSVYLRLSDGRVLVTSVRGHDVFL